VTAALRKGNKERVTRSSGTRRFKGSIHANEAEENGHDYKKLVVPITSGGGVGASGTIPPT